MKYSVASTSNLIWSSSGEQGKWARHEESARFDSRRRERVGKHYHLTLPKQGRSESILNGVLRSRANPTDTGDEQWTGNRLEFWL